MSDAPSAGTNPQAPYDPTSAYSPASEFVQTANGTYQQVDFAAQPAEQPVSFDPMTGQPVYASQQPAFDSATAPRATYNPAQQTYGQQQFDQQVYGQPNYQQGYQQGYQQPYAQPYGAPHKEKVVAGLLAIFLGSLGIHKFYLGYSKEGLIMLLVTLIGGLITLGIAAAVMGVIALVEGILYLTKSDAEFDAIYAYGHKGWF